MDNINATAIEFGGLNLTPADIIKQPQKGLAGAMVIHPVGATWTEDAKSRANATVTPPAPAVPYRDFAMVWNKSLNMRWANGTPVENIAAEGGGMINDAQDNSGMAINYKSEPLWYRFGYAPDAPFGRAQGFGLGDIANMHMAHSNALVGGDPVTPILRVKPGQPFRTHVLMATGSNRGSVFRLGGHVWAFNPFQPEKLDPGSYPMPSWGVASVRFGWNPMAMYIGAQEGILPASHFSMMFPSAGGANAIPGDYLFRDYGGFGNLAGLWGILRVTDEPEQP
ncbi:hypothetical protein D3C81_972260 [compost metagenome]